MNKYLVLKMFAQDSTVFAQNEIVEMEAKDAASLLEAGNLQAYVEEKKMELQLDTKSIVDAINSLKPALAPAVEQKMGVGEWLQGIARKTINVTTGNQGQFATTTLVDPNIDIDVLQDSGIAQRATVTVLTGTNNIYKKNVINTTGTAPAVVAESGTAGASQPLLTQFTFNLSKVVYRYDATEEALEDTGALVSEITSAAPPEFAKFAENGMINTASPLTGVVGHAQTVSIAKESGQTDDTIVAENVDKMFSSAKRPGSSVWTMSRSAYAAVQGLEDSAGNRLFQGPNGIAANVFGTLKGLPIVVSDYCAALGLEGDIVLGNWSKYQIVTKGGLKMFSSSEVKFLEGETVFLFKWRLSGQPVGLKLTATDGTEIGDFVTLADRGSL